MGREAKKKVEKRNEQAPTPTRARKHSRGHR